MKKVIKMGLTSLLVGLLAGPSVIFAAASGNYTDLLPIGASGNTTVISNGSGWSLTTLAPSQTFGDALSRAPMTVYQSTTAVAFSGTSGTSTFTALSGLGFVGSTTYPATWVASGRSVRVTVIGSYATNAPVTGTFILKIGTTSVLSSGAISFPGSQDFQYFSAVGVMTIAATGTTGTVNASHEILLASGTVPSPILSLSTNTASAVSVDLTTQLTINPTFKWSTATASMTVKNVLVEFLN